MSHYSINACGLKMWERGGFKRDSSIRKARLVVGCFKMLWRDEEVKHREVDIVTLDEDTE